MIAGVDWEGARMRLPVRRPSVSAQTPATVLNAPTSRVVQWSGWVAHGASAGDSGIDLLQRSKGARLYLIGIRA